MNAPNHLCLWIPSFELQALLLSPEPPKFGESIGLLDTSQVPDSPSEHRRVQLLHFTPRAAEHQLYSGMRAAHALGRCPDLKLLTRQPHLERRAQEQLLEFAVQFSPDIEDTRSGTVCIDLTGSRIHQRHGVKRLFETAPPDALSPLRLQFGLASTPELAQLAAHLAAPEQSPLKILNSHEEVADLPLDPLRPFIDPADAPELFHVLDLWGIRSIGEFLQLSPEESTRRLGPCARKLHEILRARTARPLRLHRPSPELHLHHELEHPVESLPPLLFLFQRLLKTLGNRLQQLGKAATAIELTLGFVDHSRYQRRLRVAQATTDTERLRELIASHFENFQARAPIEQIRLALIPGSTSHLQTDAFQRRLRDPNHFAETLARIEALVGTRRIGRPQAGHSHRPDHFKIRSWREFLDAPRKVEPAPHKDKCALLPLRLSPHRYRPAIDIQVETRKGTRPIEPLAILSGPHTGPIIACSAPRPLSGHWWEESQAWRCIEWDVQLPNSPLLRLSQQPSGWTLQGWFL